ncbi:MAG: glycosyltransferase family 2 protein [Candidatus Sumerlaeia bacterium]|nr:glycosyltransferase family 2 protein [Candidatus Sumerlaeia bacterium]
MQKRGKQTTVQQQAAEPRLQLSVIIPLFNEEANVEALYGELADVLSRLDRSWEVLFIDDGSRDATVERLQGASAGDPHVRIIRFRRNFGQTAAISAGIDHARGQVLCLMDGDLQNDPADLPRLLDKLEEGYDVVSGWRRKRRDPFLTRRLPSAVANRLISWISGVRLHDYGCTLKVYRRDALADVRLYGEMHRFIPIYAAWYGGRIAEIEVNHRPRRAGRSKYGLARTGKVILDLMVIMFLSHYSRKPIYVFGGFGLAMFAAALAMFAYWFYEKFLRTPSVNRPALPALVVGMTVVGFLAIFIGLLAEMITRVYYESQHKPTYAVKEVIEYEKEDK